MTNHPASTDTEYGKRRITPFSECDVQQLVAELANVSLIPFTVSLEGHRIRVHIDRVLSDSLTPFFAECEKIIQKYSMIRLTYTINDIMVLGEENEITVLPASISNHKSLLIAGHATPTITVPIEWSIQAGLEREFSIAGSIVSSVLPIMDVEIEMKNVELILEQYNTQREMLRLQILDAIRHALVGNAV